MINFTTKYWVFMACLCYIPLMRRDSVEQYQVGGCNAPLSGFDRLGTFSWWPFSPKISSAPVTWVFLCSLGGTMSRVFVRIHWIILSILYCTSAQKNQKTPVKNITKQKKSVPVSRPGSEFEQGLAQSRSSTNLEGLIFFIRQTTQDWRCPN